jgi:chromosome segregation ATPase
MANEQSEVAAQLNEGKEQLKAALDRAEVEKQEMKQQVQAAQASYEAMLAQTGELRSRLAATESANNELREQIHILQQKLLSHAQSLKGDNEQRDEVEKRARTAEAQLAAAKQKLKGLQYVVHEQEEKVSAAGVAG